MSSAVVLDLDATLVNTFGEADTWHEVNGECRAEECKRLFALKSETGFMWGTKRPNLSKFLNSCFRNFDVVAVWSAGTYVYVHEVVEVIFGSRQPEFVWTKEDCIPCFAEEAGVYVNSKPLTKLWMKYPNLDPKKTLLFDDSPDVCEQDPLNHKLVPPWDGTWDSLSKADSVLDTLADWMDTLKTTSNYTLHPMPDLTLGFGEN